MMTVLRSSLFACAAVQIVLAPAVAFAAAPPCGEFALIGGEKDITVIDNTPAGKSPGDVRAGWRRLNDENGAEVGSVQFVATLTEPGATGGDILTGLYAIRFTDGAILTETVYQLADSDDTSQKAGNATLIVTGGTGTFSGVAGTIEIEPGTAPRYLFNLQCP
jgi:hypothetical protein